MVALHIISIQKKNKITFSTHIGTFNSVRFSGLCNLHYFILPEKIKKHEEEENLNVTSLTQVLHIFTMN